jgi:hypothetical protein
MRKAVRNLSEDIWKRVRILNETPGGQNLASYPFATAVAMKAEDCVVVAYLDFPPPLQRREKIGFSSQRIRKSFTSRFQHAFQSCLPLSSPCCAMMYTVHCVYPYPTVESEECFHWARCEEGKECIQCHVGDITSQHVKQGGLVTQLPRGKKCTLHLLGCSK